MWRCAASQMLGRGLGCGPPSQTISEPASGNRVKQPNGFAEADLPSRLSEPTSSLLPS
jgi:hypothetical protein